jgi:hypothetical protein
MHTGSEPHAVKVSLDKVNALTGKGEVNGLQKNPQNYIGNCLLLLLSVDVISGSNTALDHWHQCTECKYSVNS